MVDNILRNLTTLKVLQMCEIYLSNILVPDVSCSMLIAAVMGPDSLDSGVCANIVIRVLQATVTWMQVMF